MPQPSRPKPTRLQILLGLFIGWQLLFLFASNATPFLQALLSSGEEPNFSASLLSSVGAVTEGWTQLTGQRQDWRLFAPAAPSRALFVTVELGRPVNALVMDPHFEPRAPGQYFHAPGSGDRLWHVEKSLAWPFVAWDPDEVDKRPGEWHKYLEDSIRNNWRAYRSYLTWRLRKFQEEHPEVPPPEALYLQVRIFTPSAGKEQPAHRQTTLLLLRCRPKQGRPAGCLPLEMHEQGRWYFLPEQGQSEAAP